MSRAGRGSMSLSGRGQYDDPPLRLEEYRAGRASIDLVSGDFRLLSHDGKTRLLAIAPTPADNQVVREDGSFADWNRSEWESLLKKAEKFKRSDLLRELKELKDSVISRRVSQESPIFDDDSGEIPMGVHSLLLHFSRAEEYLRVRGTATQRHRRELRSLGLRWNLSFYEWESNFSESLLKAASDFVKKKSRVYNPDEIGYERCSCGRWNPERSVCPCKSQG